MPGPYILALDIGTSSTRAILFDASAQPVPGCVTQIANHLQTSADGGATFDTAHLLTNVVAAIDQLLQMAVGLATQIAGVTTATFVSNVVGVDASGEPVTPVFTYADTRNADDADALRTALGRRGHCRRA